ncbi:O-methylsterigmatocystin oxidoreductase [Trametes elegans]|nr:O-methylsterigmatocystin oxidoreductase [Trametes elegans]
MAQLGLLSLGSADILVVVLAWVLLPPGPRGLPFIGNALAIPPEQTWLAYRDLSVTHGDVVALQALGQTIIILSSLRAITDLLERRSAIYSDRPASVLAELTGWVWNLAFKRYGDDWRHVRRPLWRHLQPNTVGKYQPVQQREARRFLKRILQDQRDLDRQIKLSFSTTILTAVHGLPPKDVTYHYVDILNNSEDGIDETFAPGAHLVEFLPWLQYLPAWLPGQGWRKKLPEWQAQADAIRDQPYCAAKAALGREDAKTSMMSELYETVTQLEGDEAVEQEKIVKETTAVAFGAGVDTSAATVFAFFCAMILHPGAQKRAQEELDVVIGPDRLPEHADRPALPYIEAMVKEILRWYNVAPLGVSHRCMEEDAYRGWRIPKGSVIVPNAWAMLHDPEVYPEPDAFCPDRFLKNGALDPDVPDPETIAFGFDRRICPGRHFANDALFISIASILHVFAIEHALDEHGQPIPVEVKMTSGFLSYLEEFAYSIRPRSKHAEALIRADTESGDP